MTSEIGQQLSQSLSPDVVSERKGLSYVTGRYVKETLNRIFGYAGWEYTIEEFQILDDFRAFAHVRLTVNFGGQIIVRDGVAVGYGSSKTFDGGELSEGRKNEVLDFACAEAVTDALKRAAVSLGPALGLELYPLVGKGTPKQENKKPAAGKKTAKKEVTDESTEEW
jgi:recombination DNA repair RAD52 pathway protein